MKSETTPQRASTLADYGRITRFNFTYAIDGGAWLEFEDGQINWFGFKAIIQAMGERWLDRQLKKQGWMTGCWIDVDNSTEAL